jgi:hypothetical protein
MVGGRGRSVAGLSVEERAVGAHANQLQNIRFCLAVDQQGAGLVVTFTPATMVILYTM